MPNTQEQYNDQRLKLKDTLYFHRAQNGFSNELLSPANHQLKMGPKSISYNQNELSSQVQLVKQMVMSPHQTVHNPNNPYISKILQESKDFRNKQEMSAIHSHEKQASQNKGKKKHVYISYRDLIDGVPSQESLVPIQQVHLHTQESIGRIQKELKDINSLLDHKTLPKSKQVGSKVDSNLHQYNKNLCRIKDNLDHVQKNIEQCFMNKSQSDYGSTSMQRLSRSIDKQVESKYQQKERQGEIEKQVEQIKNMSDRQTLGRYQRQQIRRHYSLVSSTSQKKGSVDSIWRPYIDRDSYQLASKARQLWMASRNQQR